MIAIATGIAGLLAGALMMAAYNANRMQNLRDSNERLNSSLQSKKRILSDVHERTKNVKSGNARMVARMTEGEA